jgi:hypothetical protein
VHMLQRAANVAEDDAVRLMSRRTTDLGLHCHRVTFNLAIKLYHDTWLMSDWSSVQCHKHSNLRNQSRCEIKRNKILNISERNS